eukprot:5189730-Amphidinium_carterae.1
MFVRAAISSFCTVAPRLSFSWLSSSVTPIFAAASSTEDAIGEATAVRMASCGRARSRASGGCIAVNTAIEPGLNTGTAS